MTAVAVNPVGCALFGNGRSRRNLAHRRRHWVSAADSATAARQNGAGSGADDFGLVHLRFHV
jgi:hypothetical protein